MTKTPKGNSLSDHDSGRTSYSKRYLSGGSPKPAWKIDDLGTKTPADTDWRDREGTKSSYSTRKVDPDEAVETTHRKRKDEED